MRYLEFLEHYAFFYFFFFSVVITFPAFVIAVIGMLTYSIFLYSIVVFSVGRKIKKRTIGKESEWDSTRLKLETAFKQKPGKNAYQIVNPKPEPG